MGPLVGFAFIGSVRTYAEASGLNGTAAGVGEAFSPLIGIWAPTFSACELAAVFLLPFVAIRLVAGDRQSGALKLEIQQSLSPVVRVAVKALVLLAGWVIASMPAAVAIILWRSYGGSVYGARDRNRGRRSPDERRPDDRTRCGDGVDDRASVDSRNRDAQRHRWHVDPQLHRCGAGRRSGNDWRDTHRPRWWRSFSTGWYGSMS